VKNKLLLLILTISILLLSSSSSYGFDPWTAEDVGLQIVYTAFHVIDWGQTRDIATNPDFIESNIFLGPYPSIGRVNTYFGLTLVGHTVITHLLHQKYRKYWQLLTIGVEATVTRKNYNLGLRVKF
jgi:hypothetical protein